MNNIITVFTPTYNRAHTLSRTYESLESQTCKEFEWIIVDDGSTDNTEECVKDWIKNASFKIKYIKKENGGLFTGYNTALEHIQTELNVCIDSDDFMPVDAIENIISLWANVKTPELAGLIGLDFTLSERPIGGYFNSEGEYYFLDQKYKLRHAGDTKIVCRTDLMREFAPMQSFGEKNFNPVWYYLKVGENHKFFVTNTNFCFVDYQSDGMTASIYSQYANSPKSFAELRRVYMASRHIPMRRKLIDAAHYVSSSMLSKDIRFLRKTPNRLLTLTAIPIGIIIYLIIKSKTRTR